MVIHKKTTWGLTPVLDAMTRRLRTFPVPEDCTDEMLKWMVNEYYGNNNGMGENPISFFDDEFTVRLHMIGSSDNSYDPYRITFEIGSDRRLNNIYLG